MRGGDQDNRVAIGRRFDQGFRAYDGVASGRLSMITGWPQLSVSF